MGDVSSVLTVRYKRCPRCSETFAIDRFPPDAARSDGHSGYCRVCHNAVVREGDAQLRRAALDALGGSCAYCGFDDMRALQIDHILGDGAQRRKTITSKRMYRNILAGHAKGLQVLCANCNTIKRIENQEWIGSRIYVLSVGSPAARGWSRKHSQCVQCGGIDKRHQGHGLCRSCWAKQYRTQHSTYTITI